MDKTRYEIKVGDRTFTVKGTDFGPRGAVYRYGVFTEDGTEVFETANAPSCTAFVRGVAFAEGVEYEYTVFAGREVTK